LIPTYKLGAKEPWAQGYANADVMIPMALGEFSPIAFSKAEEMYDIGYQTALKYVDEIKKGIAEFSVKKKKNKKV